MYVMSGFNLRKALGRVNLRRNFCSRHPDDWVELKDIEHHHIHYLMDREGNEHKDWICKSCHRKITRINTELVKIYYDVVGHKPDGDSVEWALLRQWVYAHFIKTNPSRWAFTARPQIRYWLRRKLDGYIRTEKAA